LATPGNTQEPSNPVTGLVFFFFEQLPQQQLATKNQGEINDGKTKLCPNA